MAPIIFPTPQISDSRAAISTYSNYSAAWCLWTDPQHTPREAQSRLEAFSQLQPSSRCDVEFVRQHLLRGYLTLKLIQDVPVNEKPDFAMTSALWLPVQTYYAVHGFGMAFLAAKYGADDLPRTHGGFMKRSAEDIVRRLLPSPFSAILQGGYRGYKYLQPHLINIRDDRMYIHSGLNLAGPDETTRDAHIAQCLNTTRGRLISTKLDDERARLQKQRKRRARLRKERQLEIVRTVAATTVFDYLYRARLKSNYEDPTMYHEGSDEADALLELVRNTRRLAAMLCAFLVALMWQTIDEPTKDRFRKELDVAGLLQAMDES